MFWSKLWLLLVTLVAGLAVALLILLPSVLGKDLERETGARLERAQHAASLLLKVNARKWMDTSAQVATDPVLVEALEQATRGPADLALVHKTVQDRLRNFNEKIKVDLLTATDAKGRVIARVGVDEAVYKDGVEGFPLVSDALRGLRGDDTWSQDGKLYRVAASPVIARDRYVGALVLGQEVGGQLAQSMKQVLDIDVAFLLRGRVLAASSQVGALAQLPVLVDQQAVELARAGRSAPLPVDGGDRQYLVVLAPFVGEAAGHKAAYALLLPRPGGLSPSTLLPQLTAVLDPKVLPWRQLAPVGGAMLFALVLGFVLLRVQAERPLKRLQRDAQALARGEVQRLDDDKHPGTLGAVARAVNTTLDRLGATVRTPSRHGLDVGPTSGGPMATPLSSPSPLAAKTVTGKAAVSTAAKSPTPVTPLPPPAPPRPTLDLRESRPNSKEMQAYLPPEQDPSLELPGAKPAAPAPVHDTMDSMPSLPPNEGPDMIDAPGLMSKLQSPQETGPTTVRPPGSVQNENFGDDEPTVASGKASHMRDLVTGAHATHPPPIPQPQPTASPEEAALEGELSQVYHDFIETKQRLGEPTDGVSLEKFLVKLKANRAQLMSRYACRTVKFQVYVKDGKAALKATPVQS
jgi:hypothetical protein